jgi:hypothetical protein
MKVLAERTGGDYSPRFQDGRSLGWMRWALLALFLAALFVIQFIPADEAVPSNTEMQGEIPEQAGGEVQSRPRG